MKKMHVVRIILISLLLVAFMVNLNTGIGIQSSIDNKYLQEFPDVGEGYEAFLSNLNTYLTERIGGRSSLLEANLILNDKLFQIMQHPIYEYGKDGYVFFRVGKSQEDYEFLDFFTDYLKRIQDYCQARGVPFIYLLNPSKATVYKEYLPDGYTDENNRLKVLQQHLKDKGINHVDNSPYLSRLAETQQVFNRKYDAGHWNALGAFWGVNNLLTEMQKYDPSIRPNDLKDFSISSEMKYNLPVSNFPIEESVPVITEIIPSYTPFETGMQYEVLRDPNYPDFFRFESNAKNNTNLLIFHGSYFHGFGHPFLARAVKIYQGIHNYQNILNFDYYFNIFQPNFVVVTSAEYATTEDYFNMSLLREKQLNPPLDKKELEELDETEELVSLVGVEHEVYITKIIFHVSTDIELGYFVSGDYIFDLIQDGENWSVSLRNDHLTFENARVYLLTKSGEKLMLPIINNDPV